MVWPVSVLTRICMPHAVCAVIVSSIMSSIAVARERMFFVVIVIELY